MLPNSRIMKRLFLLPFATLLLASFLSAPASVSAQGGGEALDALTQVLGEIDDPAFQLDILKGMGDGLKGRRNVPMPKGWDALEAKLAKSENAEVRRLAQSLALIFGSKRALAGLRQRLADGAAPLAERQSALASLVSAKDPELVAALLPLLNDRALRGKALSGLASYADKGIPPAILKVYASLNTSEKRAALSTLASRAAFARVLLNAVAAKQIPTRDLSADIVRQLRDLKQDDINATVAKVWGVVRESPGDKLKEIEKYTKLITTKTKRQPDLAHGRALFARTCQQCHTLYGVGGKVGPDITGSNRNDLGYTLHNILDPNAEIPNDYRTSSIDTTDDRTITGIVTRQDSQTVTIVTQNETLTLARGDVADIQLSQLSMMPEGLLATFKPNDVRDLVAYLRHPSQAPMLALPENLDSFFNGKDLSGWSGNPDLWSVENGEIVGKSAGLKKNEWLVGPLDLADFKLSLQVKLVENKGNSGIQFRSKARPNGMVDGYQADVGKGWWGKLYEEHGRALLWKESGEKHVKLGEWNRYEVVAKGAKVQTFINGNLCVDLDDPKGAKRGIIAFQLHSGGPTEVRFKDLKVELLD
jgi:putative heme-binding domain-containing protein